MLDLVTGGAGFIGSHLTDRLLALGRTVRVVDNMASGNPRNLEQHKANPRLEVRVADVADPDAMAAAMTGVERVFHLAALADIVPSIQNPEGYFRSNVVGTFVMLQAARAAAVRRFVYVASSSCYGIPDSYPTPESAEIRPQYPYALTKWLGECQVMHWAQVFGLFLAQLLAGKPLTVVGDGEQTRDFTYVSDAVDALICAVESRKVGLCLNVGSDNPVSVNYLAKLLKAPQTVHIPKRPGEPDCTFADTRR